MTTRHDNFAEIERLIEVDPAAALARASSAAAAAPANPDAFRLLASSLRRLG